MTCPLYIESVGIIRRNRALHDYAHPLGGKFECKILAKLTNSGDARLLGIVLVEVLQAPSIEDKDYSMAIK